MNVLSIYGILTMLFVAMTPAFAGMAHTAMPYHPPGARCSTGVQIVYVGSSLSCRSGYSVTLVDLSQPTNSNGVSSALLNVYFRGTFVNSFVVAPGQVVVVRGHGAPLDIYVQQTFAGLYAYQKWAKMSLFQP